jgi:hypothetical protein
MPEYLSGTNRGLRRSSGSLPDRFTCTGQFIIVYHCQNIYMILDRGTVQDHSFQNIYLVHCKSGSDLNSHMTQEGRIAGVE